MAQRQRELVPSWPAGNGGGRAVKEETKKNVEAENWFGTWTPGGFLLQSCLQVEKLWGGSLTAREFVYGKYCNRFVRFPLTHFSFMQKIHVLLPLLNCELVMKWILCCIVGSLYCNWFNYNILLLRNGNVSCCGCFRSDIFEDED